MTGVVKHQRVNIIQHKPVRPFRVSMQDPAYEVAQKLHHIAMG